MGDTSPTNYEPNCRQMGIDGEPCERLCRSIASVNPEPVGHIHMAREGFQTTAGQRRSRGRRGRRLVALAPAYPSRFRLGKLGSISDNGDEWDPLGPPTVVLCCTWRPRLAPSETATNGDAPRSQPASATTVSQWVQQPKESTLHARRCPSELDGAARLPQYPGDWWSSWLHRARSAAPTHPFSELSVRWSL